MTIIGWNYLVIAVVVFALAVDLEAVKRRDWFRIVGGLWSAGIWPLTVLMALWKKYR